MTGEVVVDASVILKWVFRAPADEPDTERALDVLAAVREGLIQALEPPHWLAEVSAVVARQAPTQSAEIIGLLYGMDLPAVADLDLYESAAGLAVETGQHVFDTVYHAVALTRPAATLITADERYCRAAGRAGRLMRLADFR